MNLSGCGTSTLGHTGASTAVVRELAVNDIPRLRFEFTPNINILRRAKERVVS